MRKFDNFITRKIEDRQNIIYADLACVQKERSMLEIQVGLKVKHGGMMGTSWHTSVINVEDDFSISEFLSTCKKHNIQCSAFIGDDETYLV